MTTASCMYLVFLFAQDLIPEDVMILDTYDEVFVWIGRYANEEEKKHSLTIATEYIESDPSGREPDSTSILMVMLTAQTSLALDLDHNFPDS